MSDTKPGRYGLRLTKARVQRMEAHATYQPQTLLALEEREPLSTAMETWSESRCLHVNVSRAMEPLGWE